MKKLFLNVLILLLLFSCASVHKYNEQITGLHSPKELHKDIDITYKKLKRLHPRLYNYISKSELDAKFNNLKKTITGPLSSREFYKKLAVVVAEIRQGHTGVIPPLKKFTKKERKELNKKKFEFSSLNFEHLDNAIWVKSTLGEDSTVVGSRVLKIDDEPMENLVDEYKKYFASDGYNTTFHNKKMARSFYNYYYADKGYKDSLTVTFTDKDSIYKKVYRRIPKDSIRFKQQKKDSSVINKKKRLTKAERKKARAEKKKKQKDDYKYGYIKSKKYYHRNLNFIEKDAGTIAYMKIRSFTYGKYKDFYEEAFKRIDSSKVQNLVIDLRNNGGGRLSEIHELYSYLTDKEFQFIQEGEIKTSYPTLKSFMSGNNSIGRTIFKSLFSPALFIRDVIKSHKKNGKKVYRFKESKIKPPKEVNFKGDIYVLINGYSFSASSVLTNYLQATKRAIIIGEESGGAYNSTVAGQTKYITLPNSKVGIYFGMMVLETPYKTEVDGYGVKPDVNIIPTHKDRENNYDAELEWVFKNIKK